MDSIMCALFISLKTLGRDYFLKSEWHFLILVITEGFWFRSKLSDYSRQIMVWLFSIHSTGYQWSTVRFLRTVNCTVSRFILDYCSFKYCRAGSIHQYWLEQNLGQLLDPIFATLDWDSGYKESADLTWWEIWKSAADHLYITSVDVLIMDGWAGWRFLDVLWGFTLFTVGYFMF